MAGLAWALVPAAGRGTRMFPAAAVIPKALLPVGVRPMLHWALEEALDAGIQGLALVVGPGHDLIRAYVAAARRAAVSEPGSVLGRLGKKLERAEVRWVEQPEPRGVGEALARCRPVTGDDDFAVLLPDNWFDAGEPAIAQVARTRSRTGLSTLGLTRVEPQEATLFGNVGGVEVQELGDESYRILALQDKAPGTFRGGDRTVLRYCARYALGPELYDALEATSPPADGEWDDVPALQHLVVTRGVSGHRIRGRHYDVGRPEGYLAAAAYLHESGKGEGEDGRAQR